MAIRTSARQGSAASALLNAHLHAFPPCCTRPHACAPLRVTITISITHVVVTDCPAARAAAGAGTATVDRALSTSGRKATAGGMRNQRVP